MALLNKIISAVSLILLPCLSGASPITNTDVLIPYRTEHSQSILLNHSGELVHSPLRTYNSVSYSHGYWFAFSTNPLLSSSGSAIKSIFNGQGQLVKKIDFAIPKDLGEQRFSTYLELEKRYALLDKDSNILSRLDPAITKVNNFSEQRAVVSINIRNSQGRSENRYGYINLDGQWAIPAKYTWAHEFNGLYAVVESNREKLLIDRTGKIIKKLGNAKSDIQLSNGYRQTFKKISANNAKDSNYTSEIRDKNDNIVVSKIDITQLSRYMYLLKDEDSSKAEGLLNTVTGQIIPYEQQLYPANSINNLNGINDITTDKFWVTVRYRNYSAYRLLDKDGKTLFEDEYSRVLPFHVNHGWVQPVDKNYWILIDSQGNTVSKAYKQVSVEQYGGSIFTYAKDEQNLNYILDSAGNTVFYEQKISRWAEQDCKKEFTVLYRADGSPVWPQEPAATCLLEQDFSSLTQPQRADYLRAAIEQKHRQNRWLKRNNEGFIDGPALINIKDIIELELPEGYIYTKSPSNQNLTTDCSVLLMSKYDNKWQLCINLEDIGYVQAGAINDFISQGPATLQQTLLKGHQLLNTSNIPFDWLKQPTFDQQEMTLSWSYQYINSNEKIRDVTAFNNSSLIKFGRQHAVWLTGMTFFDTQEIQDQLETWSKRIHFKSPHGYSKPENINCDRLPSEDATLTQDYDYLPGERCFPYSIDRLLTGSDNTSQRNGSAPSITLDFIAQRREPQKLVIAKNR